jgi:DivIVA domain-containing protein
MPTDDRGPESAGPRLTPAEVHTGRFRRAGVLHPGYDDGEVDRFVAIVADELSRLTEENASLRHEVDELHEQVDRVVAVPAPSDQAVSILATAQRTADEYVAEAEEFSRQMTSDARAQYEETLREARERAGAIIEAAQETAARITAGRPAEEGLLPAASLSAAGPTPQELQEQVAYLQAFGRACRTQLRAYLEALLQDVETEWGRAHPNALPPAPRGPEPVGGPVS